MHRLAAVLSILVAPLSVAILGACLLAPGCKGIDPQGAATALGQGANAYALRPVDPEGEDDTTARAVAAAIGAAATALGGYAFRKNIKA